MNTNAHIFKCIFQKYGKYKDFVTRQFVYRKGEVRIALYIISFYEIRNPVKLLLVQKVIHFDRKHCLFIKEMLVSKYKYSLQA